ncbi:GNAT family N-acetyltransferase [Aquitalea magnusonii]|nr:GNAT family N-acetyltransferase [Aquitalea magnusonii]
MRLEIKLANGNDFMELVRCSASENLLEGARNYVELHISHLKDFYESRNTCDPFKHVVAYAVNEVGIIVGFRYFYHKPGSTLCHLFATFVDVDLRKNGIASSLIKKSFELAVADGCTEFEVRLTEPSVEKDALFYLYKEFAKSNSLKLKIYYWNRLVQFDYETCNT